MLKKNKIISSAPGRICLFGEHQDYLNLPVIASAISLRVNIAGERRNTNKIELSLPDIKSLEEFEINGIMNYDHERDYFKSAYNVLLKKGATFSSGINGTVHGDIPINSGTSSSSALIVAWIKFLSEMSDRTLKLTDEDVAALAYESEVLEFNEPGGMMDMYSSAVGGVVFLEFEPEISVTPMNSKLGSFVLGDSGQPKNTKGILSGVKNPMLEIIKILESADPLFSIKLADSHEVVKYNNQLNAGQMNLLRATINNYQITLRARELLKRKTPDQKGIGKLLTEHHEILSRDLKISTNKIDTMIEAALDAGAYGAKINGSGGGGCMFAYAPENPAKVAENIKKAGGKAYLVTADRGVYFK